MTREELKAHCEHEIEMCKFWARVHKEEPHGKIYEEHKLILELLEQETVSKESYDHEYFLRKEFELKIDKLQRQLEEQAVKAEPVLDKIKAEIEQNAYPIVHGVNNHELGMTLYGILQVIDKYKAESKDK